MGRPTEEELQRAEHEAMEQSGWAAVTRVWFAEAMRARAGEEVNGEYAPAKEIAKGIRIGLETAAEIVLERGQKIRGAIDPVRAAEAILQHEGMAARRVRSSFDLVREFHEAFNRPIRDTPDVGSPEERILRVRLMLEEVLEFAKAAGVLVALDGEIIPTVQHLGFSAGLFEPDLVQMAHELADIEYVTQGTAVQLGIPLDACVVEVHAANMRKLGPDGKPIVDEHGKVRKPEGWVPADVASILRWERLFSGEQTPECDSCPDRADFETLCCKGAVGATVTDPEGLLAVRERPCPDTEKSEYRSRRSGLDTTCDNCGVDEYLHRPRSCNLHADCDAADAYVRGLNPPRERASHCNDGDCGDHQ